MNAGFPLRRGVAPDLLVSQVRNTAPFLFEPGAALSGPKRTYLRELLAYDGGELGHRDYFRLCLCAHWATAGTYVPTDVDNAIRLKHWKMDEAQGQLGAMVGDVLEAASWDYLPVTARLARTGPEVVATHEGTWFSVAVGAYAAVKDAEPEDARKVLEAVISEAQREAALFGRLLEAGDGLELLRACALLAHNFGDLDRVTDMWALPEHDELRRAVYKAAAPNSKLFGGLPAKAGALNQKLTALENHRHYALREARCLRRRADFLLPVGPFFDGLGEHLARELPPADLGEVVRALIDGWQRLNGPVGYARALAGILEAFPGGLTKLAGAIPGRDVRILKAGPLRALCSIPRARFEAQWAAQAKC